MAHVSQVGTVASFDEFHRRHRDPIVRALALTLGDAALASDAADEAMCRTLQRWDKVSTYANPQGWAYRVGLNWARSWLRRRRRERDRPVQFGPTEAHQQPVDPNLVAALNKLSVDHRSIVVLRYYLDWSIDEVAEALNVAPGTVKSRSARALDLLRVHMGGQS